MKESDFQSNLKKELKKRYPGCLVLKNDPSFITGIPDLLILFKDKWIALECKKSDKEEPKIFQKYYISKMNDMSAAFVIYPENKEEVLNEMDKKFQS